MKKKKKKERKFWGLRGGGGGGGWGWWGGGGGGSSGARGLRAKGGADPRRGDGPAMKDKSILSRFGIVILVLLALVLIFPSAKIDLASSIEASTQASVRVEHIQNFARSAEMDVQLLSADDPAYQQIANVLSGLTCVKRFNQQYSSYSHEYPVDSVTVSYYDDAENNNLLFTVYSDGTAIVNSQFVKIKAPKGGAEEVYQKLAEIVK